MKQEQFKIFHLTKYFVSEKQNFKNVSDNFSAFNYKYNFFRVKFLDCSILNPPIMCIPLELIDKIISYIDFKTSIVTKNKYNMQ